MKKEGLSGRDEEIKRIARVHFFMYLLMSVFVLALIISFPYALGKSLMTAPENKLVHIPEDASVLTIWFGGLFACLIFVMIMMVMISVFVLIVTIYKSLFNHAFERAVKEYNENHRGNRSNKKRRKRK